VADVCIHNQEINTNNREMLPEEAHYCVVLLQQYGLTLDNSFNLEF